MSLQSFFAQNALVAPTVDFIVSERFVSDGKPVSWQLRALTEAENEAIRASATRQVKGKNGVKTAETDKAEYISKVAAACVVFPDLKNAELQQSYGVLGDTALLRKMLLPGEYANLVMKVQEINGFDQDINDLVEEVKN